MEKEQKDYSSLKVFATLLVVFGHSSYIKIGSYLGNIDYSNLYINNSIVAGYINQITAYIYSFHMPLFVFISGAVYYYHNIELDKKYSFIKHIKNKFSRLLIPYFLISLFYVVPIKLITGYFNIDNLPRIIKYGVFLGIDAGHLWYIFMLFVLFLIFYLVESQLNKMNKMINLFIMFLIYWKGYEYLPNLFQISYVARYMIYFYIGYLFQANKNSILELIEGRRIMFLIGTVIYFFVLGEYSRENAFMNSEVGTEIVRNLLTISLALIGIAFSYLLVTLKVIEKVNLFKVNKYCFGIYLLHDPINYLLLSVFSKINIYTTFNNGNIGAIAFVGIRFLFTLLLPIIIMQIIEMLKREASLNISL
ncbi:acyltransferase family protein [Sedimentibacter saalensis]|uniref:acyltransferase family protein n=1 Tax=Sedimentibacter saalensis TaxID=130788 RepID=UPI00289C267C|nr:acyltransferase [Sedimentibacter saalensis]